MTYITYFQYEQGDPVILRRDRNNPHDANAVEAVFMGKRIGYVPIRQTPILGPLLKDSVLDGQVSLIMCLSLPYRYFNVCVVKK